MIPVSVIVPTYNKCQYLELTLASFLRQTSGDFEVIVVNDGSGVSAACGEWVIFCDDDRLVAPDFVETHLRCLQGDPRGVVLGFKQRVLTYWRRGELPLELHEWLTVANRTPGLVTRMEAAERLLLCTPEQLAEDFEATVAALFLGDEADNQQHLLAACDDDLTHLTMGWAQGTTVNMSVARRYLDGDQTFDELYQGWGLEDTDLSTTARARATSTFPWSPCIHISGSTTMHR